MMETSSGPTSRGMGPLARAEEGTAMEPTDLATRALVRRLEVERARVHRRPRVLPSVSTAEGEANRRLLEESISGWKATRRRPSP